MRFCISLSHRVLTEYSLPEILDLVRVAEDSGIDSVWVTEEIFKWDAFAILGSLALGTSRIRLGPGVTSPYVRPPYLQAMSSATLNRLSQGRAFLGLGRGITERYSNLLAKDVSKPVTFMRETIQSIRHSWSDTYEPWPKTKSADPEATFGSATAERNQMPIYVAAIGPKMLNVATDLADGVIFAWPSLQFLKHNIESINWNNKTRPRDNGKDFAIFVHTGICVTSDIDNAFGAFKDQMAMIYSIPGLENALISDDYDIPQIVGGVRDAMKASAIINKGGWSEEFHKMANFHAAREAIPHGLVEQVAIAGSAKAVHLRLSQYQTLGVTHVFVPPPWGQTATQFRNLLESINPKPADF